ncbi:MAG: HEAT repeat domain-containing protein [Cyanobacteria bacterium J06648_16]
MSPEQRQWYEAQLRSRALNERKAALDQLAAEPAAEAIPILQALASQGDVFQRRLAMMGFAHYLTDKSLTALTELMAAETDGNVLAEAANSLFDFGERAIPLLVRLFKQHSDWLLRQTVLSLLMESEDVAALLSVAADGMDDPTQTVKETAILALRQIWGSAYQDTALALLAEQAKSEDWRTRWRVATALTGCQAPLAKTLLAQLRQDPHHRVVAAALEASL